MKLRVMITLRLLGVLLLLNLVACGGGGGGGGSLGIDIPGTNLADVNVAAASRGGSAVAGNGNPPGNAIDESAATVWAAGQNQSITVTFSDLEPINRVRVEFESFTLNTGVDTDIDIALSENGTSGFVSVAVGTNSGPLACSASSVTLTFIECILTGNRNARAIQVSTFDITPPLNIQEVIAIAER